MTPIILASSSPYRRLLMDKLGLNYIWQAPNIDESPSKEETPEQLVMRLARQKALALAGKHPKSLIIGSDQIAVAHDQILGKPLNYTRAHAQLSAVSGQTVTFFTGLCLLNTTSGQNQLICETYNVFFRNLTSDQIDSYLRKEEPYDCAGSFKSEGLGISLFSKLEGRDPNTLIGLPLIALIEMLNKEGVDPLA